MINTFAASANLYGSLSTYNTGMLVKFEILSTFQATAQNPHPPVALTTSSDQTSCIGSVTQYMSPADIIVQIGGIQTLLYEGTKPKPGDYLSLSATTNGYVTVGTKATAVALAVDYGTTSRTSVDAYMLVPNTA